MRKPLKEDPSGYTTTFTRPDGDKSYQDRNKNTSRSDNYPYDMPISTGRIGIADDQSAYSVPSYDDDFSGQITPKNKKASDEVPKNVYGTVWEAADNALDTYEAGPQAPDAPQFGQGAHGLMGDGIDPFELDLDALRNDFRTSFDETLPKARQLGRKGLFALLVDLDPEYSAELFAPDEDDEMADVYDRWGQHVYAPGAENDSGVEVELDEENEDGGY